MKERIRLYIRKVVSENLEEKSVSKSQQQFMGMVKSCQDKPEKCDNYSKSVKDAAKDMKKTDVEDFASTKHKGLPNHVNESANSRATLFDDNSEDYAIKICDDLWPGNNFQRLECTKEAGDFRDEFFPGQTLRQVAAELDDHNKNVYRGTHEAPWNP